MLAKAESLGDRQIKTGKPQLGGTKAKRDKEKLK
jgi:hypothetical protein